MRFSQKWHQQDGRKVSNRPSFHRDTNSIIHAPVSFVRRLRGSCTPGECETDHIEASRKIHVTSSWYSLFLAQCHPLGRKLPASGFSLGKKRGIICPVFWHFRGLPKVLASVSPSWSTDMIHHALDAWRPLRLKKKILGNMLLLQRICSTEYKGQYSLIVFSSWGKRRMEHSGFF